MKDGVQDAGDIDLQAVSIITSSGKTFDLLGGYLGELNLYEDLFRGGLYGNILIFDANNINQVLGLTGDELLYIKMVTPSMNDNVIEKTFKCYSITDKFMYSDSGKQTYIIHFCSPEVFMDALTPIYKTFKKARATDLVGQIFEKYLATSRTGGTGFTPLVILGSAENEIQFTSPGWRPSRCLNWLASKTKEAGYNNPGYVFFETNKAFYFANVEHIMDLAVQSNTYYSDYYYMANNIDSGFNRVQYSKDIDLEYKKAADFKVIESFNALKNTQTGYLANRLFTLDYINKKIVFTDYDHVDNWGAFKHLENIKGKGSGGTPLPPFNASDPATGGALRAAAGFNQVYVQHPNLYTGVTQNANEIIDTIMPVRTSTLAELDNWKIEITVPGRTDIEVGAIVNFHYPDASPRDPSDLKKNKDDNYYSGFYLVTAIRHKITHIKHMMILELVKDSVKSQQNAG
jgi:hypothetical protein